ncbi:MAG: serine/threonine protein kinase [Verrucomicrobiales bacterium]|nr:serine/threonine protein kinase [Verrucomicrobiales bacterium]
MADPLPPHPNPAPNPNPPPSPPPTVPCPDDERLRRLLHDALPADDLAAIGAHLESCPSCRRRLDSLAGSEHVVPASRPLTETHRESAALSAMMEKLRATDLIHAPEDSLVDPPSLELLTPPVAPGSLGRFAGYDVLERVASGGMGIVFKARDPGLSRVVAIKVLAPVLAASDSARARFLREARAAAAVTHEHVVAIHAVGEERGLPFLVMQFVSGKSLETRLRQGLIDLPAIHRIGLQTAEGLAAAHAQGLVHRDVKPGNILLENGVERVKLTDFGLARAADEPGVTRPGVVAGTPEFMSPEQARGERIDARSDLFGLGCVLYLMATGQSPFAADSTPATLRRVCEETPAPAHRLRSGLPPELSELIRQLMAKQAADRPESASTVAERLREMLRALDPGTASSRPARPAPELGRDDARSSRWLLPTAVTLLVLGAAVWTLWRPSNSTVRTEPPAAAPTPPLSASTPPAFAVISPAGATNIASTLEEAVATAASGATVELRFTGQHESRPIRIVGKKLFLRAAPGTHPVVVNQSSTEALIGSDAILVLEGLELRSSFADSDVPDDEPPMMTTRRMLNHRFRDMREGTPQPSLISMRGGELHLAGCRLVTSTSERVAGEAVALRGTARAVLRNCEFYNLSGATIWWLRRQNRDQAHLEIRGCLFYSAIPVFLTGTADARCRVDVHRCTVLGSQLLVVPNTLNTELTLAESVIVARNVVPPGTDFRPPLNLRMTEEFNLFFLRPQGPAKSDNPGIPGTKSATLGTAYGERLQRLKSQSQRLEPKNFELRPEELDLLRRRGISKDDTANAPPLQPGARAHLVGPGDAYARWRQTEDYEAWQRETYGGSP